MATKKTITSNTHTYSKSSRHIISKFNKDDVHCGISILRELYPKFKFTNYNKIKELLESEFDCEVNVIDVEKYFQPSVEAIAENYNYLINIR